MDRELRVWVCDGLTPLPPCPPAPLPFLRAPCPPTARRSSRSEADLLSSLEYIKSLGVLHPEPHPLQQPLSQVNYDTAVQERPSSVIYDTAAGMVVQERPSSVIYDTADPRSSRLQYTVPR